jgi:hypothetical protein
VAGSWPVRRWDARGGTATSEQGLIRRWKGHRGGGERGGVMGFVQIEERGRRGWGLEGSSRLAMMVKRPEVPEL